MKKTKKNIYLLALLIVTLLGIIIIPTYAKFPSNYTSTNDIVGLSLEFNIGITNIEEYEEIEVLSGEYEIFNIEIENASSNTLYYGVWYRMNEPSEKTSAITIARLEESETTTSGSLDASTTKTVSIIVINNTLDTIKIDIGVASSDTSTADIEYIGKKRLISGVASAPLVNVPNLDNGNLIPVYYDNTNEVWKKADSGNANNSWYDYENKKWANAVIKDPNTVVDLSNNLNNGVIDGATWDTTNETITTDGVNDKINLGMANYDFGSDISFVLRVKINALNTNAENINADIFGNYQGAGGGISLTTSNKLRFILYLDDVDGARGVESSDTVVVDTWYTLVGTYDGTTMSFYMAGELLGSTSASAAILPSTAPFFIGYNPDPDNLNSVYGPAAVTVSDVLIFDRALTASEISSNYSEIPNPTDKTDLLLYYDFSDGNDIPVGTTIGDSTDNGTLAFYTWIPRFKYRVWNISRQGGDESTYAYSAFTNGIDIKFESGTESTGNVECNYNTATAESETTLSDVCVYNGTDTITTESVNTNYTDAWYTHPAFTFGDKKLTGFWIGKFETTGTSTAPTVLPDVSSLRSQTVSTQFTTSRIFQNYLSDDIEAHMLTNLEWGAVVYLTQSIYGLCDGTSCRDAYLSNSNEYYTGRSSGAIAGQASDLATMYGDTSDSSTNTYNAYGYYDYKGYQLSSAGAVTSTKDTSKVASTTGNITGVYDMSGCAYEHVMGNMVDSTNAFYPSSSGTSWNGSTTLNSKYYNAYSYGTTYSDLKSFNKARLGDATTEVLGEVKTSGAWQPGKGITGAWSSPVNSEISWFLRGGLSTGEVSGIFYFNRNIGNAKETNGFRSAIS